MKNLKILTLNCQKGIQPAFKTFFIKILLDCTYDIILLQESNITVLSIFKETESNYKILNLFDIKLGENSQQCIIYKSNYILNEDYLISFAKYNKKMQPYSWGLLVGVFNLGNLNLVIGSVHLHPGLNMNLRIKELKIIKNNLLKYLNKNNIIILGGDFNSGLLNEISKNEKLLIPEFNFTSKNIGYTLNSRYTEIAPYFLNRISYIITKFGLSFKFQTDNFFIDSNSLLKIKKITCSKLIRQVSDHSPVELILTL